MRYRELCATLGMLSVLGCNRSPAERVDATASTMSVPSPAAAAASSESPRSTGTAAGVGPTHGGTDQDAESNRGAESSCPDTCGLDKACSAVHQCVPVSTSMKGPLQTTFGRVSVAYPAFRFGHPQFEEAIENDLRTNLLDLRDAVVRSEGPPSGARPSPGDPFAFSIQCRPSLVSSRVVSVRCIQTLTLYGAARPHVLVLSYNYDLSGNKPEPLEITDLFVSESSDKARLADLCLPRLPASYVQERGWNDSTSEVWSAHPLLTRNGVSLLFDPDIVGTFGEQVQECAMRYTELDGIANLAGPIRAIRAFAKQSGR